MTTTPEKLKELYVSGLIDSNEVATSCIANGWTLARTPTGRYWQIKGRDNNARWVLTLR